MRLRSIWTFSEEESLSFWANVVKISKFPRLSKVARLLLSVPASAIAQERHFSELKRRCAGLRARTKVEVLDRDGVLHNWFNSQ